MIDDVSLWWVEQMLWLCERAEFMLAKRNADQCRCKWHSLEVFFPCEGKNVRISISLEI